MDAKLISTVNGSTGVAAKNRLQELQPNRSAAADASAGVKITETTKNETVTKPSVITIQSNEQLDELVEELNVQAQNNNRTLRFSVDEKLGRSVITVVDRETDEVIRQIPPETALQIAQAIDDVASASGNLLSDQAWSDLNPRLRLVEKIFD